MKTGCNLAASCEEGGGTKRAALLAVLAIMGNRVNTVIIVTGYRLDDHIQFPTGQGFLFIVTSRRTVGPGQSFDSSAYTLAYSIKA
jgi:hypothetical protein